MFLFCPTLMYTIFSQRIDRILIFVSEVELFFYPDNTMFF